MFSYFWELVLGTLVVALLGVFIFALYQEQEDWKKFKVEHNCNQTAHISGTIFNTVGINSNGGMTIGIGSTPDKDCYTCDDGMTYCR